MRSSEEEKCTYKFIFQQNSKIGSYYHWIISIKFLYASMFMLLLHLKLRFHMFEAIFIFLLIIIQTVCQKWNPMYIRNVCRLFPAIFRTSPTVDNSFCEVNEASPSCCTIICQSKLNESNFVYRTFWQATAIPIHLFS